MGINEDEGNVGERSSGVTVAPTKRKMTRGNKEKEKCTAEIDDGVLDNELKEMSDSSSIEEDQFRGRYKDFNAEKDIQRPHFDLGMRFTNGEQFKEAIRNFCIGEGKSVKFKPSEPERVGAKCKNDNCDWSILASTETASKTKDLVIKSINLKHKNCNHEWKNPLITAKWIAKRYMERIKANNKIPSKPLSQTIDEDYKSEISKY
ncbi:hypothetical protein M9H77_35124 [Catharanthus roseus]|uniref:Uncharacterized protein n=1 Tax=Catharanthus roseus TaxID=4058 RepID=A0ACB9ZP09_CATRO|nr:hypothetical protein M9H77_35124 [Catharanthus roseus]